MKNIASLTWVSFRESIPILRAKENEGSRMRTSRDRRWRVYNIATYNVQRNYVHTYVRATRAKEGRERAQGSAAHLLSIPSRVHARVSPPLLPTCVTYARSTGALINSVALRAENGGSRSRIVCEKEKKKEKWKREGYRRSRPADKRASGARRFILSLLSRTETRWNITYMVIFFLLNCILDLMNCVYYIFMKKRDFKGCIVREFPLVDHVEWTGSFTK